MSRRKQKKNVFKFRVTVVFVLLVCIVGVLLAYTYYTPFKLWVNDKLGIKKQEVPYGDGPKLEVAFLNVGQGDCILLCFPDGKNMLIDSGKNSTTLGLTTGENKKNSAIIDEALQAKDIETLDYVLATHQDSDHIGNLSYVFEHYQVNTFFKPNVKATHEIANGLPADFNTGLDKSQGGLVSSTKGYAQLLVDAYNEPNCTTITFDKDSDFSHSFTFEEKTLSYTMDFLTPIKPALQVGYKDANDYSPILLLTYGNTKLLLTGDAEKEMEKEFVEHIEDLDVDILKVGHHGSETSSSAAFLDKVNAEYAVIQCGNDKGYQHPRRQTLDRLVARNMTIYRTDNNGDIILNMYPDEFSFTLEKEDCSRNHIGKDEDYANGVISASVPLYTGGSVNRVQPLWIITPQEKRYFA